MERWAPAFVYEGQSFDVADVLLAAIGWGEWQQLELSLAEGLERAERAERMGQPVPAEEVRREVVAFRRARGLISGEDFDVWLASRGLKTGDLDEHHARRLLCDRADADGGRPGDGRSFADTRAPYKPPKSLPSAELALKEALLSGALRSWAERLARCLGADRALAGDRDSVAADNQARAALERAAAAAPVSLLSAQAVQRAPRIADLLTAERRLREITLTCERIERCLADHALDWRLMRWQQARFASEGAAREALIWISEQGLSLADVAAMARAPVSEHSAYSGEVPDLAVRLLSAGPGEPAGPVQEQGEWRLLCLRDCAEPDIEDPTLRERARDELMDGVLERHLAGRIAWHDGL